MPRARLMREIGSREMAEWIAYSELEPFGEERADYRSGIIASTIANFSFSQPKEPLKPSDFMPQFADEPDQPDDGTDMTEEQRSELVRKRFEFYRLLTGGKHVHRGEEVSARG